MAPSPKRDLFVAFTWLSLVAITTTCVVSAAAASTTNITSLEWPYSELLAKYTTEVEQCSKVSGFGFRNNTSPNVQQLARMCADPDCVSVTNKLFLPYGQDGTSYLAAFAAFTVPVVDYCWYLREPGTPCPVDKISEFLSHVKDKDANCARGTGYSFVDPTMKKFNYSVVLSLVPSDCWPLGARLQYLYYNMPCPLSNTTKVDSEFAIAFMGFSCPPKTSDSLQPPYPYCVSYTYSPGWPLPPTPTTQSKDTQLQDAKGLAPSASKNTQGSASQGELAVETSLPGATLAPAVTESTTALSGGKLGAVLGASVAGVVFVVAIFVIMKRIRSSALKASIDKDGNSDFSTVVSPSSASNVGPAVNTSSDGAQVMKAIPVKHIQDIRMIGTGGYGVVFLVRDTLNNRLLASKRLSNTNQLTTDKIDAFFHEIQLVSTLEHPCIVTFIGATWTNRTDVQALFEYMDGGDLRTYLDVTPMTDKWTGEKLTIAIDIIDALEYVHSARETPLVHRDLKSRNVLLSKSPRRAKLSDFGVARELSQNFTMTDGVGTSRWLAPEVILGGGDYGTACDVYSFGVVLSELDTHKIPFWDCGGATEDDMDSMLPEIAILRMVALEGRQPSLSASCPPPILELARQCLAHNPADRPTAATIASILRGIVSKDSAN